MFSQHIAMNAWREILARIFEGFAGQTNVSPEWLINPATRRRLKLDSYYPDAGVAVRFIGLTAKGQGRQSDWEALETQQRDQTRVEICRLNGVQLAVIDPVEDPGKQMDSLLRILSRASRILAQGDRPDADKQQWMPALGKARSNGEELRSRIVKDPQQMLSNLAEFWRDRESAIANGLQVVDTPKTESRPMKGVAAADIVMGNRIRHAHYGDGVVTNVSESGDELMLSILFDAEQERTFLLSLVADKMEVIH